MGKYWKADVLRKLIKIEEENGENATITMSYLTYLKKMLHFASSEDSEIKTFDDIDISKVESIETSEGEFENKDCQNSEDEISQCPGCHCMTKTIKRRCGKCGAEKSEVGQ